MRERIAKAPSQVAGYIGDAKIPDALARAYGRVTGRSPEKVTPPMRRFLAAIFRTHGEDLESLLRELYADWGETDLLLPSNSFRPPGAVRGAHGGAGQAAEPLA